MLRKCLFPAASYDTRFLPATKAMPKEMLPVMNKPLIQYGVEETRNAGLQHMAIVTGRDKRALEDHFDISYELEHQTRGSEKEKFLSDMHVLLHPSGGDKCQRSNAQVRDYRWRADSRRYLSGQQHG